MSRVMLADWRYPRALLRPAERFINSEVDLGSKFSQVGGVDVGTEITLYKYHFDMFTLTA